MEPGDNMASFQATVDRLQLFMDALEDMDDMDMQAMDMDALNNMDALNDMDVDVDVMDDTDVVTAKQWNTGDDWEDGAGLRWVQCFLPSMKT